MRYYLRKSKIVYFYKNNIYLNITNKCPVVCSYCIKYRWNWKFRGNNLYLKKEPTLKEIITELKNINLKKYKEVVFCGYGEPTMRFNILKNICVYIKKRYPYIRIRLNTSGLGNFISKKDITSKLQGLVDIVSVSLNAQNNKVYTKLHKANIKNPVGEIKKFIKNAKKNLHNVVITTINHQDIDINKIKKIAENLKVKFRLRPFLNDCLER